MLPNEPITTDDAAQLERARAHATLGAALRRAGRREAARDSLRLAVDLAHRCGARQLEDEALAELRAAGGRPRRLLTSGVGSLTPSERRVAELAAAGSRNREIAETLFVTISTVEFHLRRTFRKLGISSRAELGAALGARGPKARHAGPMSGLDPALLLRLGVFGDLDIRLA